MNLYYVRENSGSSKIATFFLRVGEIHGIHGPKSGGKKQSWRWVPHAADPARWLVFGCIKGIFPFLSTPPPKKKTWLAGKSDQWMSRCVSQMKTTDLDPASHVIVFEGLSISFTNSHRSETSRRQVSKSWSSNGIPQSPVFWNTGWWMWSLCFFWDRDFCWNCI